MHPDQKGTGQISYQNLKLHAQVAELVDALVSNTNEVTLVPVRLRLWVHNTPLDENLKGFLLLRDPKNLVDVIGLRNQTIHLRSLTFP